MIWVLAAAISLSLAQQPAKPPPGSASSAAHVTTSAQKPAAASAAISTPTIPSDASSANPANVIRDSDLEMKLTWFTGALAAVAILQFIVLLWQGFTFRKMAGGMTIQSHEMEHQTAVLDEQLKILARQLTALQDTASAASSTAAASKESVDLIVKKERARLRIELAPFYLNFGAPSPANYAVQHEGSTDAFVIHSNAAIYVSDSREPDPSLGTGKPMPLPSAITPQNPVVMAQDVLDPFTAEEIEDVRQQKSFVHFTGFVRYKDVFDGEHETRFNRVWSIAKMNHLGDEPFTYWEHCGAANDNCET